MTTLFTVDLEEADFSDFDSTSGTDLSVIAPGLVASVWLMEVDVTDATDRYGQVTVGANESRIRLFFALDTNQMTMANGDIFTIAGVRDAGWTNDVFRVELGYTAADGFRLRPGISTDGAAWSNGSWVDITDNEHIVEVEWFRASSPGANSGYVEMWVDVYGSRLDDDFGAADSSVTGVDNDTLYARVFRFGAVTGLDAGTSGPFYLDHMTANDTGDEIGHPGILSFPTAEGAGRFSVGGREGAVIKVTNLNDSGAGSLRTALTTAGPRIIVFEVDGIIALNSTINVDEPYLTILGQTAPGDGVCVRDYQIRFRTHNIIIRHFRHRQGTAKVPVGSQSNGLQFTNNSSSDTDSDSMVFNVILDHVTSSWAADGVIEFYNNTSYNPIRNITIQWSMAYEALEDAGGGYSQGISLGTIDGIFHRNISILKSILAHNRIRNPWLAETMTAEVINCVIHDVPNRTTSHKDSAIDVNYVGNTITDESSSYSLIIEQDKSGDPFGDYLAHQVYVDDNDGNYIVGADDWLIVGKGVGSGQGAVDPWRTAWESASLIHIANSSVDILERVAGRTAVLAGAGCFPRDSRDTQIITDVEDGNTGILSSEAAYPTLSTGTPDTDTDGDGIPDDWEDAHGLDKNVADDDGYDLHDEWTNIEIWSFDLLGEEWGAVSSTVEAAICRTAATVDTAPYTQDLTTADLESVRPVAAIHIITRATADGTAADNANFGIGVATADDEWAAAFTDEHGQGTTDSASRNIDDGCILILDPGDTAEDGEAAHNAFIANGERVTWNNAPASAYLITSYYLAGIPVSAKAGTVSLGDAVDNAVVVNTVGFEADIVIAVLQDSLTATGSGNGINFSMGVVHNGTDITQRAFCLVSQDGQATSALAGRFTESYGAMAITTAGALDYGVEFGSFNSAGFTATTRNAGGNSSDLLYLALSFGGTVDSSVLTVNTPTTTGSDTQPPPGFVPSFVMQMVTHLEAADTAYTDGKAGVMCLSAFDEDDEYSNSVAMEDGAGTSNTQCISDNQSVNLDQHDGTDGHEALFVAFSSWTLDWTKTLGTAKIGWAFALGMDVGTPAIAVPSALVVSDIRRHEIYLTNDIGTRLADSDGRNPLMTFLWFRASRIVNGIGWIDMAMPQSFDTTLFCKRDFMIQVWRAPRGGALSLWRPYLLRRWRFETFDGVDSIILSGPDINDLLRRRWVIAFAGSEEADKSNWADDMMKELVTEAMLDSIPPVPDAGSREWDLLSVAADLGEGPAIKECLAFKGPLLSKSGGGVLPKIARASRVAGTDLFFDVVTSSVSAGSIEFEFRTYTGQRGQDLSSILTFDEAKGNMGNAFYDYDASDELNYIYGEGQGDGRARNDQQVYDAARYNASVWNRCEAAVDASSDPSSNAVREKARDVLQSGEPVERAGGTLKDTEETRYGTHWNFGDLIRARYKGHEFISMINSIVLSVNRAGEQVLARWDYTSDV